MNQIIWAIFIVPIVALTLLIPFLTADWMIAQAQNATLIENENNTRTIVNMKERLIFLVNATSNETIRVSNFTGNIGNATTNEAIGVSNFTGNIGNATTNENLTNATTIQNLSAKFKSLQGE